MNNSMMEFGPDSPALEGTTWWKPDGTDHFTIRDILMSPEGFSIRTMDGRIINGDVMETYIQSEVPINIPKEAPVQKINLDELDEISDVQLVDKQKDFGSLRYNHDVQFQVPPESRHHMKQDSEQIESNLISHGINNIEQAMIDRVLGKINFDELVNVDINPIETIDMGIKTLEQTLNVNRSEIKSYLISKVSNKFDGLINKAVSVYLDNLLGLGDTHDNPPESSEE